MNILSKFIVLFVLLGSNFDSPTVRAKEFFLNAYNGKTMDSEEWLTKKARLSKFLEPFGGLDAFVRDCAAEVKRNRGIKEIIVIRVHEKENIYLIEIEVVFNNNEKSNGIDAWTKEDEKWKITVNPGKKIQKY
ncbi:MAG: hypothetical protein A2Y79_07830 [Deltaproteobacteria bacterium RBG_13_43_22]|nr:MAG: hypothetical protein A2Y79_07830 [Deltaproteobacteria bacterium RBG_13_43_22]